MLVLSGRSGQLAARIWPRLQLSAGPLVVGAGLAMLTLAPSGSSYVLYVLPAVVVFGPGLAITVAPLPARGHRLGEGVLLSEQCLHCGLDAPPLRTTTGQTAGTE
jgi:hypothetical protein